METQRTKILLVQNDHMGQIALERFVRKEALSYDCVFVNSVSEGKRAFESEDYDVVVTDYMLIDGDACDLVSIVHIDVPVVVVTEAGDEDLKRIGNWLTGRYDLIQAGPSKYLCGMELVGKLQ